MSLLHRLPLALLALAACAHYRPPFTQPPGAAVVADAQQATVVFLWPLTSCDPPGYMTLATGDGRFIGNISRGSRVSALVPAGESTVIAWNSVIEAASGKVRQETVAVLHADLREGRTYYVRMAFGEWADWGPPDRGTYYVWAGTKGRRVPSTVCMSMPETTTSAMVALSPASDGWRRLPEWLASLEAIAPDRAAGQAWLEGDCGSLERHLAVGQARFAGMRAGGRRLATLEPDDGAPP